MRRRDLLLAAAAMGALPVPLRAQMRRIPALGALILANPDPYRQLLSEALRDLGYVPDSGVRLDFRVAEGSVPQLAEHAANLVQANVDVIVAIQTPAVRAAMQVTTAVPIVLVAGAPIETGLVASLHRPGGNVTGVSTTGPELSAKTLDLMHDAVPSLRRVGVLLNGSDMGYGRPMLNEVEAAARSLGIEVTPAVIDGPERVRAAVAAIVRDGAGAVIVQPSLPRREVLALTLDHRMPTMTSNVGWTRAGALMSYAPDLRDVCRKAASYVDRILRGAKPADLPVEQPTAFEFVINLRTARALGLSIPDSVLARADEVLE